MARDITTSDLIQILSSYSAEHLKDLIVDIHPVDILEAILEFDGDRRELINKLSLNTVVELLEEADDEDKIVIYDLLSPSQQKQILREMASDELVDFLESVDPEQADSIIKQLDKEDVAEVKRLMGYGPESAGGIMATEFIVVKGNMTVWEVLHLLQKEGKEAETTNTLYVLDDDGYLIGVASLSDIVVHGFNTKISDIMNEQVISVRTDVDQEEVGRLFQKYGFASIPVVDHHNRMQGIITSDDIMDVLREENTEDFEKMAALIHNEVEYLDSSVINLAKKRITWLLVLMISATFTGLIIQGFENALSSVVILAAFIPMLMDTGGNAGAQSATLIIRGMALGEVTIKDFYTVLYKEFRVSIIVGLMLAIINFGRVLLVDRVSVLLSLTVSISLFFTVVIAKAVGCVLPIIAKSLKVDPAIMAAPIITTIVDALSLIVYFTLATIILQIPAQ
ncbi:MAG: magnesium transporter [Candidatus Cloacimonetes bacterium]|nr:magnesium transporter [Candidatus Cloacimonadota bacterium]